MSSSSQQNPAWPTIADIESADGTTPPISILAELKRRNVFRVAARAGQIDPRTRSLLDSLEAYGAPGSAHWSVEVAVGDLDAAFATADSMLDRESLIRSEGGGGPPRLANGTLGETSRYDWWFRQSAAFRRDPRFVELMRGVGLVDFWQENGWPDLCRPQRATIECS